MVELKFNSLGEGGRITGANNNQHRQQNSASRVPTRSDLHLSTQVEGTYDFRCIMHVLFVVLDAHMRDFRA